MMQKRIIFPIVLAVVGLLLIGFGFVYVQIEKQIVPTKEGILIEKVPVIKPTEENANEPEPVIVEEKKPISLNVKLVSQNNSKENGTAIISEVDGRTSVLMTVYNFPKTGPQPAHIHEGACPTPGAVKYSLGNVVSGISTTTLNITAEQLLDELPLAINIHKSSAEAKIYVSCGDIKKDEGGTTPK